MDDAKILYGPEEAAEAISVSRSRMFQLISDGEVESIKIGRVRRIPRTALDAYVDRLRTEQVAS